MRSKVAGSMYTVPCATAVRSVSAFSLTSTIHARPSALKCVKSGSAMLCSLAARRAVGRCRPRPRQGAETTGINDLPSRKRLTCDQAQSHFDFANHIPYSTAFADALTRRGLERYTSRADDLFARPGKMQVL